MAKHDVDAELVRKLAGLLDETNLTELEYATQALRVRVVRQPAQVVGMAGPMMASQAPAAAPAVAAAVTGDTPGAVTSPMVGTVYVAQEPGAASFVKVGDTVRQGQTLLIIEAMKVMNPLPAPRAGKVVEVLVRDAQPVEFGEVLMVIE
jgi:acetyl-CoA carboxylase biotin carboxyl carrier protein